jgi:hypothetical protein
MPCHRAVGAGKPISVILASREGARDPTRRASLGRGQRDASGAGYRFDIDVVSSWTLALAPPWTGHFRLPYSWW